MAAKINKAKVIAAAQKYMQKGQHERAIREYTKIVQEDPRDVRIWLKIGDLQAKKGTVREAVDTYLKVAEFYSEQGFYLKAVAVYKQILKLDQSLVDVNLRLAELYKQLGLLNDAMQRYEMVSNHFHQAGRTRDALAALRQIVDLDPENVASRIKLAELYSKEAMRAEAIEEFSKAADFLRASNRLDDFVKVAERLAYHQPENVPLVKELASLYLRREDPRRALQKLQVAFKSDPRAEDTLEMLAQAFENLGQVPKTVSVWKELALIHRENGQRNKEAEVFERILELVPTDADARAALAALRRPAGGAPRPQLQLVPPAPQPASLEAPARSAVPASVPSLPGAAPHPSGERGRPSGEVVSPRRSTEIRRPSQEPVLPPLPIDISPSRAGQARLASVPARGEAAAGGAEEIADRVARVVTEAEVYIKYGLHDKAADHLKQIFSADPDNIDIRLKLRDLYSEAGRYEDAAAELYQVGRTLAATNRRRAAQFLNEALELDPQHLGATQLLGQLETGGSGLDTSGLDTSGLDTSGLDTSGLDTSGLDTSGLDTSRSGTSGLDTSRSGTSGLDTSRSGTSRQSEIPELGPSGLEMLPSEELDELPIDLDADDIVEEIPIDSLELLEEGGLVQVETDMVGAGPGSGVIELRGETVDTIGGTTPAAEIIQLPVVGGPPSGAHQRMLEEEASTNLEDDLEEADFFIQQGLYTEARSIIDDLTERYPQHPLVESKRHELMAFADAVESDTQAEGGAEFRSESSVVDMLAEELASTFDQIMGEEPDGAGFGVDYSVEDVFHEFKRGVDNQISEEDSDTHYDLGIAYREMGLLDDAVTEFKVAMRSKEKEVLCHMMIGLCFNEKGLVSDAISQFKSGLYVEGISERETVALYFELGQAYEQISDLREALYYYEKVAKRDARFREVEHHVDRLRQLLGDEGGADTGGSAGGAHGNDGLRGGDTDLAKLV